MSQKDRTYRVFISAAESSADAICAGLIAACKEQTTNIEFVGVGGPKMAQAGCNLLQTTTERASMGYKAFRHIFHFYRLIKRIHRYLKNTPFDLVVVCDSPAFNFHIAKIAKKQGIKTLFYVAPQLWAWGAWRAGKLRKYCDKLACTLPFEQQWFKNIGIDATFVGHPLLDNTPTVQRSRFNVQRFILAPGSRIAEINSLWLPMQTIALRIKEKYPSVTFTTVAVDEDRLSILKANQIDGFECHYTIGSVSDAAARADFALVASGSATLQVAAAGCPMVIMYQSSKILWQLVGRWLVKTKKLSLVNILAGKELVPEFMPYFRSIDPIVRTIEQLLEDKHKLSRISNELVRLVEPLAKKKASTNTAKMVMDMLIKSVDK